MGQGLGDRTAITILYNRGTSIATIIPFQLNSFSRHHGYISQMSAVHIEPVLTQLVLS